MNRLPMLRGHAEALMPLIARVMERAKLDFAALDRIAVTTGPGSFTGLRVGIAAARGIALAAGKPAVGLVDARPPSPRPSSPPTMQVPVVAAVDARHEHVYLQVFGPGGRTLVAATACLDHGGACASAPTGEPRLVGTAAKLLARGLAGRRARRPARSSNARRPTSTGWRGSAQPRWKIGAPPKPLYLRAPDAQPQDAAPVGAAMIWRWLFARASRRCRKQAARDAGDA